MIGGSLKDYPWGFDKKVREEVYHSSMPTLPNRKEIAYLTDYLLYQGLLSIFWNQVKYRAKLEHMWYIRALLATTKTVIGTGSRLDKPLPFKSDLFSDTAGYVANSMAKIRKYLLGEVKKH